MLVNVAVTALIKCTFFEILTAEIREVPQTEEKQAPPSQGLLVAEPYSWKSLVTGQPVLRIRTTGTKAAVLVLPPGYDITVPRPFLSSGPVLKDYVG